MHGDYENLPGLAFINKDCDQINIRSNLREKFQMNHRTK